MKLTITVTAEDIRLGRPGDPYRCPITLAVLRHPSFKDKEVATSCYFLVTNFCGVYRLPPEAISFIKAFDTAMKVKPLSFEIEVPE